MRADLISIFPEYFDSLDLSLIGKAQRSGKVRLIRHDLRDFASDRHRSVDDAPYGGGPGMVMRAPVWGEAIDYVLSPDPPAKPNSAELESTLAALSSSRMPPACTRRLPCHRRTSTPSQNGPIGGSALSPDPPAKPNSAELESTLAAFKPRLVVPSPSGRLFDQRQAESLAECEWLIFACGRYEGIDARVMEYYSTVMPVDEISIGDYVLAGGEVAAIVILEAVIRLLPDVLGNELSIADDSFAADRSSGDLEGPVYTRPAQWRGLEVPQVLLSGDHAAVRRWRHDQSKLRTQTYRP